MGVTVLVNFMGVLESSLKDVSKIFSLLTFADQSLSVEGADPTAALILDKMAPALQFSGDLQRCTSLLTNHAIILID
jgi:hypothetical protein